MSSALYSELSGSARAKPKGVALRPHRGDRLGLGQGLPVADGPVLHPTVGVVHQAREVSPGEFPLPDGHLKGVQGQVGARWPVGGLPADEPPRVHVGHESHIDPPGEGAYIGGGTSRLRGNVGDPQLTRGKRLEVAPNQVGRTLLSRRTARGARRPGASDSAQAQVAHEAFDGTAGHVTGTVTLGALRAAPQHVHLAGPQHRGSWFLWTLDISALKDLVAQAPGARRPATASVSQVLGAIS